MGKEKKSNGYSHSETNTEGTVRPSIAIRMIRHAESKNNQVYRDARHLFRGGTPDFDSQGWANYVDAHRKADPGLSDIGHSQSQALAKYMIPHLQNQASRPVHVICSPMKRTLETILPTLEGLATMECQQQQKAAKVVVNAWYHESEGCYNKDHVEEGMSPREIRTMLQSCCTQNADDLMFEGFPQDENCGWYANATGAETRAESEVRATKFYTWLCDYLDGELAQGHDDVFDAGVNKIPGEEQECEHDKFSQRLRRRRMTLLVGHGDFMSLVLKRIVAGFGHFVEHEGIPHRSAFVHWNTGTTELEYFGNGRFLLMSSNQTPHIGPEQLSSLRTGGSLKDGWSYLMPQHKVLGVSAVPVNEELNDHVKEQAQALKSLYQSDDEDEDFETALDKDNNESSLLSVEELEETNQSEQHIVNFFVKRGLQIVACVKLNESSMQMSDLVLRPTARSLQVCDTLVGAVRDHVSRQKMEEEEGKKEPGGDDASTFELTIKTRLAENKKLLVDYGFREKGETGSALLGLQIQSS